MCFPPLYRLLYKARLKNSAFKYANEKSIYRRVIAFLL